MCEPEFEAVILAAGSSSRLLPQTREFPKCLLPLGNKTILSHLIESFKMQGISRFTIVAGYRHRKLLPFIENENATLILNRRYRMTGSLYSLWLSRKPRKNGLIIANSDVYLEPRLFGKIISGPGNAALIDALCEWDPESTKVKVRDGRILIWSRDLPRDDWSGENIGIIRICQDDVAHFYDTVDKLIVDGHRDTWWPEALNQFVRTRDIVPIDSAGMLCKEVDTYRDYVWLLGKLQAPIKA